MKKYVAFEWAKPKRGYYGFTLYRIKNNKLQFIDTSHTFRYGCTKGQESEVLTALCDCGEYPKKYRQDYYDRHYDKIHIQYIVPYNQ